jgi:hypothetical protein
LVCEIAVLTEIAGTTNTSTYLTYPDLS